MSKDIKNYLHLYLRSELLCRVKRKNDTDYYIGKLCEVTYKSNHGDWAKFWFDNVITVTSSTWETSSSNNHWFFLNEDSITPILRPLSDMTEEESERLLREHNFYSRHTIMHPEFYRGAIHFKVIYSGQHRRWPKKIRPHETPEMVLYLLKQGFDLFGLIENGLAIDKTKS